MKKIDSFINQYSLNKTLRFKLIPYGSTLDNFKARNVLEQDRELAESYSVVKDYIDDYHKAFIDKALGSINYLDISNYSQLYYKSNKSDTEKKRLSEEAEKLRKTVVLSLSSQPEYKQLFGKELIQKLLPEFLDKDEERETVRRFYNFTTYFTPFHKNRANMYTYEEKATGIAYRCINDNLPKFLDNAATYSRVCEVLPAEQLMECDDQCRALTGAGLEELFSEKSFAHVLGQSGISRYNEVIGAYTNSDGSKVQGLNEYINLHNQKVDRSARLPKFKVLFKQILSDRETISFIPEKFGTDDEVLSAISKFYTEIFAPAAESLETLFSNTGSYEHSGIFLENAAAVSSLSQKISGSWHTVRDAWNARYDAAFSGKKIKDMGAYEEKRDKEWKKTAFFSFAGLDELLGAEGGTVGAYYKDTVAAKLSGVKNSFELCSGLFASSYADKPKRLAKNQADVALIKNLLDSQKEVERIIKPLMGGSGEDGANQLFYSELDACTGFFRELDLLYDKTRNYITKKPYSNDKIKLNFDNSQLLGGWDKNKERDYRTVLLRKDGKYYLGVMDKSSNRLFDAYLSENSEGWEKIEYKLLPGPNKMLPKVFFSKSKIDYFAPSAEVMDIYERGSFKKGDSFSASDCHKLIAFFQQAINRHPEWCEYGFKFKAPKDYADISEFYWDVATQGYKLMFKPISAEYIEQSVEEGRLYLFQIYNKDFSSYSKGTPNMHTLYFKMLFDERNLENVVYQLNGGAEMFYRLPSIKEDERIIHHANEPVKNKNPHNGKTNSLFAYDIVKDKRYTEAQFFLHLPITMNFKADGTERINLPVRKALKDSERNYVIGIDRGERHLVYITLIDDEGNIVKSFSGNQIMNEYNGKEHTVDYHALLTDKERERMEARQNWNSIESISQLKEGYISQIVHLVCRLAVEYDAVIAMEDLNFGFKNSRTKVEKSVYQKFEKMLIDKLNYMVDKKLDPDVNGGLLRAYQLTEKFDSFRRMSVQNGFIFYVPAWLTSKIDPSTGFVDLLYPRYKNEDDSKSFISKFRSIVYDKDSDLFKFTFDYRDFPGGSADYKGIWTVCSYADRIEMRRDESANGKFMWQRVQLTEEWKKLFDAAGIDCNHGDIKAQILAQSGKSFFERFMRLLRLTLQMRNSIPENDPATKSLSAAEIDYIVSPVMNSRGEFFDSRRASAATALPSNADENGAYNIARKALWAMSVLKNTPDELLQKANISIHNKDWLEYAQNI